jgi:hypothetical protein
MCRGSEFRGINAKHQPLASVTKTFKLISFKTYIQNMWNTSKDFKEGMFFLQESVHHLLKSIVGQHNKK